MKKRITRSPGRTVKGKERPGLLARGETTLESAGDLQAFLATQAATADQPRPLWLRQCEAFEAFARQFTDEQAAARELALGASLPLTTYGKAGEVVWWADCLRQRIADRSPAGEVANVAMTLAGKMIELTILANEEALIVGGEALAPKTAATLANRELADERWKKVQAAAEDVWREHPKMSKSRVAEILIARELTQDLSFDVVRKGLIKPTTKQK
ncbi:MAG TPA: hypothetical protein PJ986_04185 [Gammaproteobacteria bacterium]|nr:hypothetical protein [Gammaproteobacteria bacterium]